MDILKKYPKKVVLSDGTEVTIRPLKKGDKAALIDFFSRVPAKDRNFLRDDVTDRKLVASWVDNLNYEVVLPLIAEYNGRIMGDITLQRRRYGWKKHVGDVRVVVASEFQKKGLGTSLVREVVELARELGLEKLAVEIHVKLTPAIKAFARC
ncbi:MAG: hypothetical protein DRG83_15105, partial [Deltaproteobacteria bacterium]